MVVYRDGRRSVPAHTLLRELETALANLLLLSREEAWIGALLRAGELECALCDADSGNAALAAFITDELATILCSNRTSGSDASLPSKSQGLLAAIRYEGGLTVSRQEGFAYYALHPLDFADLVSTAGLQAPHVYVVGIRSIGTVLSAVAAARLNADGIPASRTTVRPEGHPYDRRTTFPPPQRYAIDQALSRGALFLVCDEGPGRSGSSLLSVAEALEWEGVRSERIVLLCSHQPVVDGLCAPRASERWRRYRSVATGMTKRLPHEAERYLGGGEWRELFVPDRNAWPAAWPQMERLNYLSRDQQFFFKFEGHGPYGEQVCHREKLLAASGFGASYLGHELGFGIHELVSGNQPRVADLSPTFLSYMAKYCAWRAATFPATVSEHDVHQLEYMAAANFEQEFGFAPELHLAVESPAICDGRIQHHKWRDIGNEHWIKLDASTHGDDHFFPGPADIAWDLAGICVEWQLSSGHREFFLGEYQRLSGDNAGRRLRPYEIAYAAFWLGWSRMAAASVQGDAEDRRLTQDAGRYRSVLERFLVVRSRASLTLAPCL